MLARCRKLNERWGVALAFALALAVFARLAGPYVGAAARDGYVAICSGSEIVYLPVTKSGEPVPDGKGSDEHGASPLHMPCSWLGHYAALLPALQTLALPAGCALPSTPQRRTDPAPSKELKPFHSRAPPSVAA